MERAADELGGEIDRRTSEKSERRRRDYVYDDTGRSHDWVLKLTLTFLRLGQKKPQDHHVLVHEGAPMCKLHFILISMAAARFDGNSQSGTRVLFFGRYLVELLHIHINVSNLLTLRTKIATNLRCTLCKC